MADWKVTWLFSGPNVGWSETLYRSASTIADMRTEAGILASRRADMLGSAQGQQIQAARISRLEAPFDSYLLPLGIPGGAKADQGRPDMPWVGAMVHARAADGSAAALILRGILDGATEGPFDAVPDNAGLRAAFLAWREGVINGGWCLRSLSKGASPRLPITAITLDATGSPVVTAPAHGLTVGTVISWYRVRIRGACLRGRAQITDVTADTYTIGGHDYGEILFFEGWYRVPVYHLSPIRTMEPGSARRRKTGRPFDLLRGRRSRRTCR